MKAVYRLVESNLVTGRGPTTRMEATLVTPERKDENGHAPRATTYYRNREVRDHALTHVLAELGRYLDHPADKIDWQEETR